MPLPRAKSLPVPSGTSPMTASASSWRRCSAATTRVQAAVAAGHHDPPAAAAVQHAVELAGVGGGRHLDVRGGAQHRQRALEVLLVGAAGLGVGDQQHRLHEAEAIAALEALSQGPDDAAGGRCGW